MGKNKITLKDLTSNKKAVAIFSVLVAFVIWLSVVINQTPTIEKTISLPININTQGTALGESGLQEISGAMERNVNVRVQGPAYIVSNLTADDIDVTPSLQSVTAPGQYSVSLTASKKTLNGDYAILSVSPSEISTKFDYVTENSYTVEIEANNIKLDASLAAAGLIDRGLKFNNPGDNNIKISGPKTETDKIKRVIARVEKKETIKKTTSYEAEIVLLDAAGNTLNNNLYTLGVSEVKVSKVVYKKKTVPVNATFSGAPAGFANTVKWTLSDSKIEIMGEPETIDSIEKIELPPIDLNKISKQNTSVVMPLEFTGGVESVDNTTSVTVTFDLSKYTEKTFTITELIVVNNENNSKVTLTSAVKNVKICGPSSVISKLSASDLCAKIDVSGKTAGEYIMPITVVSRSGKILWQIGSYEASVSIK
ncbi:MAG: hypothetical protein E7526_02960 [Ruminococcaceae bacterium]|nr:hypothetical protein [Oscillospiraceae bacterium]